MFKIHTVDDGRIPPLEYLPASEFTPKIGMALIQTSGKLDQAAGAAKPTYISMCDKDSDCAEGDLIPVFRVDSDLIFETTFSASAASIKVGNKVTVATDGLRVTATTTDGVAEVVYMDGTTSGSMCRVRF